MKKVVKNVGLLVLGLVASFALLVSSNAVVLDFDNSGNPYWLADSEELGDIPAGHFTFKFKTSKSNGFKNSGLPETIEIERLFR